MKKYLFIATALVALASCSENEFVGDQSPDVGQNEQGAIVFNSGANAITRADHVGADAADLLGNKFIVGGYKGGSAADGVAATSGVSTVFDNYIVEWHANTAATTESNTSDWEYVGITAAKPATVTGAQTIKYWDYSASQYDFIAYSVGKGNTLVAKTRTGDDIISTGTPTENNVWVTPITPSSAKTDAYSLRGLKTDLLECYIADMKTISKTDYNKEVQLDFRRLASKVRIALYETIPGYSVKKVMFYSADNTPIKYGETGYVDPIETATLFVSGSGTNVFNKNGTYTISFPTIGSDHSSDADFNQAHVQFTADASEGTVTTETFGTMNYGAKERNEAVGNIYLGRTTAGASFAGTAADNYYKYVLPNEKGAIVELRVDYTLLSIDGSGEEIVIRGAKAFIPAAYTKWNSNFAYTYIFKISDNTNGWSSQLNTDPAGLYPITFDAVITEAENYNAQTTITTVATPSITTYQKGHNYTDNVYKKATGDIYVQVMKAGSTESDPWTLANDLSTKGQLYSISISTTSTLTDEQKADKLSKVTEAEVLDALNVNIGGSTTSPITGRNEFVLTSATSTVSATTGTFNTIPSVDNNTIPVAEGTAAKLAASNLTAGYYAYVYDATGSTAPDATYYYSAQAFASTPTDWATSYTNYYTDPDGTKQATEAYNPETTYYLKVKNLNRVYGVKVIKIE